MDFVNAVRDVVMAIPAGYVLSYGDVAALAGRPANARQVGKILGDFGIDSEIPCHRVVTAGGRPAPHWPQQRAMLRREGVNISPSGNVDMKRHRWPLNDIIF